MTIQEIFQLFIFALPFIFIKSYELYEESDK